MGLLIIEGISYILIFLFNQPLSLIIPITHKITPPQQFLKRGVKEMMEICQLVKEVLVAPKVIESKVKSEGKITYRINKTYLEISSRTRVYIISIQVIPATVHRALRYQGYFFLNSVRPFSFKNDKNHRS